MKREGVIIESFVIDKPKQVKILEVRIPRTVDQIVGVELGFNLLSGGLRGGGATVPTAGGILISPGGAVVEPVKPADAYGVEPTKGRSVFSIKRNVCIGEIRLQCFSKANLFYAGELVLDNNLDYADFTTQFFPPKVYTHQLHSFETEVKLTAKHRLIRGIYRDKILDSLSGKFSYRVNLYLWATKLEKEIKP